MFCQNCGNKISGNESFCPECGSKIEQNINLDNKVSVISTNNMNVNNQNQGTLSQRLAKKNPLIPIWEKIKEYFNMGKKLVLNNKKTFVIGSSLFVICIISLILFNTFYDFTELSWDKENGDANIMHTEATTLTLNVLAFDREKKPINDIKFTSGDGEITADGLTVEWTLPDKVGTYTITAIAPSGKKIIKEVKVVKLEEVGNASLGGVAQEEIDNETADTDKDGLTNAKEKEVNTNPNAADTDKDGISDYYEINATKTNPLKLDTDKDGISDGDELDLGLDPLKSDSKGDGIKDGERTLTYSINDDKLGVYLEINGKGNIASATIDVFENATVANIDGLLDEIYNFYTNGTISSATVKIKYDINEIQEKGLNEDNLTLYYFNEETKLLEAIPTTIDKISKTITVKLNHFSKYVIGDDSVVLTNVESQIMFVIDNSISMYSMTQMIEAGYDGSTGAVGNDTTFKRLSLTNKLVDMFTGNYKFGVAEFSGDYVNLKKFSSNHNAIKKSVNSMNSNWESDGTGTNIISALKSGIKEFSSDDNGHYLILLTDGKNTEGSLSYNKNTIINSAKDSDVKICVIGLGSEIDTDDLNDIAEETGCDYYNASDSSELDEIYSLVGADINYNYLDTDGDNKVDGMIHANSGFLVNRDGFSFSNFSSNKSPNGHCYGMATFATLYYTNQLPMSLAAAHKSTIFKKYEASNGYNLNNTYFASNKKLYDYKTKNEALTNYLYDNPGDYRDRVENNTWMIKKEYYNGLEKIGATFSIKDYKGTDTDFKKYQSALLNIDNKTFENAVSKDESQILSAIFRLFILQVEDDRISFSTDSDKAFEELNSNLSSGTPIVTIIAGNHAINSIKLIQDINDSNKFKIEVYDNNYPGEVRYIDVTRSKYSKWQLNYSAWKNEYEYTFMYDTNNDGIKEDISVDLSHPNVN